jgi:hypothetical protein
MATERNFDTNPSPAEAPLVPELKGIIKELEKWREPLNLRTMAEARYDVLWGYLSNEVDAALAQTQSLWDALEAIPEEDKSILPDSAPVKKDIERDDLVVLRDWWESVLKIEEFEHPGSTDAFEALSAELGLQDLLEESSTQESKPEQESKPKTDVVWLLWCRRSQPRSRTRKSAGRLALALAR